MGKIIYVIGDATYPIGEGNKIICHIVNDENKWGAGFVLAISKRWSLPERHYRSKSTYKLGMVDILVVDDVDDNFIYVANMIGQHGISDIRLKGVIDNDMVVPPIRYEAIREALSRVNQFAVENNATLHMPRIGCGLAGGKWGEIEKILLEVVIVPVTVYDLK